MDDIINGNCEIDIIDICKVEGSLEKIKRSFDDMLTILKSLSLTDKQLWEDEKYGMYYRYLCSLNDRLIYLGDECDDIKDDLVVYHSQSNCSSASI